MSDYRGHVVAGVVWFLTLAAVAFLLLPELAGSHGGWFVLSGWGFVAQLAVAVLAALWPDVDTASRGRKVFYRVLLAFSLYSMARSQWKMAAVIGLAGILPAVGNHRGWTHTVWAAVLVPLPIVLLPLYVSDDGQWLRTPDFQRISVGLPFYVAAMVGLLSHLAADGFFGVLLARMSGGSTKGARRD
ncbi:MAG TPA: metal-dependent hydrolase [Candidatus Latescibacteria bacterium]|nr:metal-dependent hydrolase [Candidatus Latescibacterota bacterium]HOS65206.1 metal-dependent hydrolase [Candidatus Latescibacterota bacterium]HPK74941.1 metal-dependent hydrolase [Candidatus Latescibacterota bacterium]